MIENKFDFLTIKQVSEQYGHLGLSQSWLYKELPKRTLKFYKPAGRLLLRRQDIEQWILNAEMKTAAEIVVSTEQTILDSKN